MLRSSPILRNKSDSPKGILTSIRPETSLRQSSKALPKHITLSLIVVSSSVGVVGGVRFCNGSLKSSDSQFCPCMKTNCISPCEISKVRFWKKYAQNFLAKFLSLFLNRYFSI